MSGEQGDQALVRQLAQDGFVRREGSLPMTRVLSWFGISLFLLLLLSLFGSLIDSLARTSLPKETLSFASKVH